MNNWHWTRKLKIFGGSQVNAIWTSDNGMDYTLLLCNAMQWVQYNQCVLSTESIIFQISSVFYQCWEATTAAEIIIILGTVLEILTLVYSVFSHWNIIVHTIKAKQRNGLHSSTMQWDQ